MQIVGIITKSESASSIEEMNVYAAGPEGDEVAGSSDGPRCAGAPTCVDIPPSSALCMLVAVSAPEAVVPIESPPSSEAPPMGAPV
jgi:hypothetical protein